MVAYYGMITNLGGESQRGRNDICENYIRTRRDSDFDFAGRAARKYVSELPDVWKGNWPYRHFEEQVQHARSPFRG
jgi:hypothetical protein